MICLSVMTKRRSPSRTANTIPSGDNVLLLSVCVLVVVMAVVGCAVEVDAVSAKRKEIEGNEKGVHLDVEVVLA